MNNSYSSGAAACLLGITEPQLNGLVRRGKITQLPELIGGRRLWTARQILEAANYLGVVLPDDVHRQADADEVFHAHDQGDNDGA